MPPLHLRDGSVWIASRSGMCQMDGDACVPLPLPNALSEWGAGPGLQDSLGRLWWSTDRQGLVWVSRAGDELTARPVPEAGDLMGGEVRHLAEARDGSVLVATRNLGLIRLSPSSRESIDARTGLGHDSIRHVYVDDGNVAWLGTDDGGLCRVVLEKPKGLSTGARVCATRLDGMPDDTVHSVTEDGLGRLWLSSNQGISLMEKAVADSYFGGALDHLLILTLDEGDGMLSRETNGFRQPGLAQLPDGSLWYPTQSGLAGINPHDFPSPSPPKVHFESVRVGGESVSLHLFAQPLVLAPDQREVDVTWSAPELSWPEHVHCRFRLDGFDDRWSTGTHERRAKWTNLPPGDFRLEVQCGLLGWGESTVLELHREAAFTETKGFRLALILVGVGVAGLVAWARTWRLRRRKRELEAMVAAATSELKERGRRLEEQTRRLEQMDVLKTSFVANVSHELRTPMALVSGPLEDLATLMKGTSGRAGELFNVVRRNAGRLSELVEQLVQINRLQSQGMSLHVRRHDLAAFVRRTTERFREEAVRRRIELDVETGCRPLTLFLEADLVDKVVSNLLWNALRWTPAGGRIVVTVRGEDTDQPADCPDEGFALVSVSDTGPGIPEQERERVFERFYQVERREVPHNGLPATDGGANRSGGTGLGLGLALCREFVEMHGGWIRAEASEGGGALFRFALPVGVAHLSPDQIDMAERSSVGGGSPFADSPPPEWDHGRSPSSGTGGRERGEALPEREDSTPLLLVVEDNDDMRSYLAAHLAALGHVETAADGRAALEIIRSRPPDVVVSDIMMPVMDGIELARAVRTEPAFSKVRVILVTARAGSEASTEGLAVADDYVTKPFSVKELLARVRNQIIRPSAGGSLPETGAVGDIVPQDIDAGRKHDDPGRNESDTGPEEVGRGRQRDVPGGAEPSEATTAFVARMESVVCAHLAQSAFSAAVLAHELGLSPRQFQRKCRDSTGLSPTDFIRQMRLEKAASLLKRGSFETVSQVAAAVGLSPAYFSQVYAAWHGHPPSDDLKK